MTLRHLALGAAAALLAAGTAQAQQAGQQGSHNPVVKDSRPHAVAAPARGHNSFTESQAAGRFNKAGYHLTSRLTKDADGVWTGTATKGGRSMTVGLDYKGNITAR